VFGFQALKVLRTAEYAPYVVFIAAPTGLACNNVSVMGALGAANSFVKSLPSLIGVEWRLFRIFWPTVGTC
jgi:hypothetical protein